MTDRGRVPGSKHLGIRLTAPLGRLLEALIEDEQSRVGDYATVNASSFLVGLLVTEGKRRGIELSTGAAAAPTPKHARERRPRRA